MGAQPPPAEEKAAQWGVPHVPSPLPQCGRVHTWHTVTPEQAFCPACPMGCGHVHYQQFTEGPQMQSLGTLTSDTKSLRPLNTPLRHLNTLCNLWEVRHPQWCCIRAAGPHFPSLAVVPEVPMQGGAGLCRSPCGSACHGATLGQALVTMPTSAW